MSAVRRAILPLLVVACALAAFSPAAAQADDLCLGADISECGDSATYAPGDGIFIAMGGISYITGCPPGGVSDTFGQAAAKIFIVPAGIANGAALTDVGGSPNVAGSMLSGGLFMDMLIGTAGVNVPTGTYDVVYDECMNDKVDPDDYIFPNAITVTASPPGQVPSISPAIAKIKADAQAQATGWQKTLFAWN